MCLSQRLKSNHQLNVLEAADVSQDQLLLPIVKLSGETCDHSCASYSKETFSAAEGVLAKLKPVCSLDGFYIHPWNDNMILWMYGCESQLSVTTGTSLQMRMIHKVRLGGALTKFPGSLITPFPRGSHPQASSHLHWFSIGIVVSKLSLSSPYPCIYCHGTETSDICTIVSPHSHAFS